MATGSGQETAPLSPPPAGLRIGTASSVAFYCNRDVRVDAEHGTLERTAKHGVWVFVDHSVHGSTLNGRTRVHHDAVIVRSGDTLTVGSTDISIAMVPRDTDGGVRPDNTRQTFTDAASSNVNTGRRKSVIPHINTSLKRSDLQPPAFKRAISASAASEVSSAVAPEYINSPIPGNNWRRRRNSMASTMPIHASLATGSGDLARLKAVPSPPIAAVAQPFAYPRGRTLVSPASTATSSASNCNNQDTPSVTYEMSSYQRQYQLYIRTDSTARSALAPPPAPPSPPPVPPQLSDSSHSSVSSVPPFLRRLHERRQHEADQTAGDTDPRLDVYSGGMSDEGPPKSRRDALRIQVAKKMAAAVAEGTATSGNERERQTVGRQAAAKDVLARIQQRNLEFTPPSSPVPQSDLARQQRSLLAILKHKYKEEQLLKQQQEEWMRQQFDESRVRRDGDGTPPLSPIRSSQSLHPTTPTSSRASPRDSSDESEDGSHSPLSAADLCALIPDRVPELLRTLSAGPQRHLPSPRVAAAVMASRAARANAANYLDRQRRRRQDGIVDEESREETVPMESADAVDDERSLEEKPSGACRGRSSSVSSSDSVSVSSSVTTEPARYRRVTRSLSTSSSNELNESEVTSEPQSSPPSPLEVSGSEEDLAIPDFFIGYGDETDEDEEAAMLRFYPDEESVSRSRSDSAPLVGSTTTADASPSEPSTSPTLGLFSMGALRSPRRLIDGDGGSYRRPRHLHDYLLSKARSPEDDSLDTEDADEQKPQIIAKTESSASAIENDNNHTHGAVRDMEAPSLPRGRRRRSAPPATLTLGLPTSKLALSFAPAQPTVYQPERNQQDDTPEQPEVDEDDFKIDQALPPPPPPPPSTEAPPHGVGPRRSSFRRRSAFALA